MLALTRVSRAAIASVALVTLLALGGGRVGGRMRASLMRQGRINDVRASQTQIEKGGPMYRRSATLVAVVAALGILLALPYSAMALNTGDTVQFLIPTASIQPEPEVGPKTDKLLYTGGSVTTSVGTGCATTGSYPIQNAILVDPGAGRSGRIVGIITTFQTGGGSEALNPGTTIVNIAFLVDCSIGADTYKKYTGTVE